MRTSYEKQDRIREKSLLWQIEQVREMSSGYCGNTMHGSFAVFVMHLQEPTFNNLQK